MSAVKSSPGFLEQAFTVLVLWFATTDLLNLLQGADASQGFQDTSNQSQQLLFFVIYAICAILLLRNWKQVLYELSQRDKILWVVLALVVASTVWSVYPDVTMRRSIALVGTTLIGVYVSTRYTMKQQLYLLCWTWGLAAVGSLILAIALPKYGLMPTGVHAGTWRGLFIHKNVLGRAMVWGVVLFTLLAMRGGLGLLIGLPMIALCVLLVVMAKSSTALTVLLVMLILIPLYRGLRLHSSLLVITAATLCMVAGGVGMYMASNVATILAAMNKDITLTGRTDMWPFIWEKIQERFWFGYGYEGFWRGLDSPGAYVWQAAGWRPPHSHNGFLEMMLIFGAVGTSIYLFGFLRAFVRSMGMVRATHSSEFLFPIMLLSYTFSSSFTETGGILDYNNIYWVMYTMTILSRLKDADRAIAPQAALERPIYSPHSAASTLVERAIR